MADVSDLDEGQVLELLAGLVRRVGAAGVVNDLGISGESLANMLSGEETVPPEAIQRVMRTYSILQDGLDTVGGVDEGQPRLEKVIPPDQSAVPSDLRPPDYEPRRTAATSISSGSQPAGAPMDALDLLKSDLFRVRMMAVRQQVGVGLSEDDILASKLFVLQIELTLIVEFGESVPVPGLGWTPVELEREAESRFRRRDRLQAAIAKRSRGFGGMLRRMSGQKPPTVDQIMHKMLDEAKLIHDASAAAAESTDEALNRLLAPAGLDAADVREILRQHREPAQAAV